MTIVRVGFSAIATSLSFASVTFACDEQGAPCRCKNREACVDCPAQSSVTKLISDLNHSDRHVREAAARALQEEDAKTDWRPRPEDRLVVQALIEAVRDPNAAVRTAALQAIESMGERARTAGPALCAALKDPDREVRW